MAALTAAGSAGVGVGANGLTRSGAKGETRYAGVFSRATGAVDTSTGIRSFLITGISVVSATTTRRRRSISVNPSASTRTPAPSTSRQMPNSRCTSIPNVTCPPTAGVPSAFITTTSYSPSWIGQLTDCDPAADCATHQSSSPGGVSFADAPRSSCVPNVPGGSKRTSWVCAAPER